MDAHEDETTALYRELTIAAGSADKQRRRFSATLKQRVARHARLLIDQGRPLTVVALSLGISKTSLTRWLHGDSPATGFREVAVASVSTTPEPPRHVVAIHPKSGLRIEGLTLDELADFLRALS